MTAHGRARVRGGAGLLGRFAALRPLVGCALVAALLAMAGCGGAPAAAHHDLYHQGQLFVATGNTTGTYYVLGGGYGDLVSTYVPGYQMRAEPTGASGENINRVDSGDMDLAFSTADVAADAALGRGVFPRPQRIVALARLYINIVQVVVRSNLRVHSFADLRGKRVSTSTKNSGSDIIAGRMLQTAGLDPDHDITRLQLSLPETAKGMKAGTIDAFVFVSGLPTPGITELFSSSPGQFSFLPVGDLVPPLAEKYNGIYQTFDIPKSTYNTPADVPTVAVPNMLLASPDLPEKLAYQLTKVLFDHQRELKAVHPEGGNFTKAAARVTDPVPLHPGAKRYYASGT